MNEILANIVIVLESKGYNLLAKLSRLEDLLNEGLYADESKQIQLVSEIKSLKADIHQNIAKSKVTETVLSKIPWGRKFVGKYYDEWSAKIETAIELLEENYYITNDIANNIHSILVEIQLKSIRKR